MSARISRRELQTLIKEVEALDNEELDNNIELMENRVEYSTTQEGIDNTRVRLEVMYKEYNNRTLK